MTNVHITGHESLDEMFDEMERAEQVANSLTTPRQKRHLAAAFENPTRWFRVADDLLIVGETTPVAAQAAREVECGATDLDYEYARFAEQHARGYIYGTAYSVIVPDGELGSTHVSQVVWCDPDVFDVLKQYGWSLAQFRNEAPEEQRVALAMTMQANAADTFMPEKEG
jgi:hypothetical protein